jgi:hypothetical protein
VRNLVSDIKGGTKIRDVFENRVLRGEFGPKRDGVAGGWRTLHNEELNDLYSSLSIIRMIKLRRMRRGGHVARKGADEECIKVIGGETRREEASKGLRLR